MNDRVLVEALRAGDPGALAALYDTYAEGIYRYCWSLLHNDDSAQVALRDTLIAAEAHISSLSDPDMLRAWLYALARGECLRRLMAAPPLEETVEDAPDPDDADLRLMARNAVGSLPEAGREALDLSAGHGLSTRELAAVLALPFREAEELHDEARDRLHEAITAEVLARKGPYDCPRRADILTGFAGELSPGMRRRLVAHLPTCEVCSPHLSRQVAAAKVFELLPRVTLPEALRVRVLSCIVDPELFLYRRYVARRSEALDGAGFPLYGRRRLRAWPRAVAGALATVSTLVAIGLIFDFFGKEVDGLPGTATAAVAPPGLPSGGTLPWRSPQGTERDSVEPLLDGRLITPLKVRPTATTVSLAATNPQPSLVLPTGGGWPMPSRDSQATSPTLRPLDPSSRPVPTPCPTPTPPITPTVSPAPPPTRPPTRLPTRPPTRPPTQPPTHPPSQPSTSAPSETAVPTAVPTVVPTVVPSQTPLSSSATPDSAAK